MVCFLAFTMIFLCWIVIMYSIVLSLLLCKYDFFPFSLPRWHISFNVIQYRHSHENFLSGKKCRYVKEGVNFR